MTLSEHFPSAIFVGVDSSGFEVEMFKNSPFTGVTHLRNGFASVPSIGGTSLKAALARVEAAETALADARAAAKAAARAAGKSTRNLFADGAFVARSSAERWCYTARAEGRLEGLALLEDVHEWLADVHERLRNPSPDDPFYHILARFKREGFRPMDRNAVALDEVEAAQAAIRARQRPDLSGNAALNAATQPDKLAKQILKAAERARSPTDADPPPQMTPLGAEIVRQGRRRRGEER